MGDPLSADLAQALAGLHQAGKIASPWLPGMVDTEGRRVLVVKGGIPHHWVFVLQGQLETFEFDAPEYAAFVWDARAIDPTDPATLGCLLAIVREAHGDETIHLTPATYDRYGDGEPEIRWHVNRHHEGEDEWLRESGAFGEMEDGHRDPPIVGATEADALLAALRAALPTETP